MNVADVFAAVHLNLETGKFEADALKVADSAGATMGQKLTASLKRSWDSGGALGVGVAAGAMAFNALGGSIQGAIGFMQDAVKAAMEDESSQAKLSAALTANVKGWDGNTAAIEKVITSRMKLGFSDEDQRNSLAVLVAKTGDVTLALEMQGAAMDLARLKGIDLAAASKAIALGMGGQGRALKELGINVKDYASGTEILAAIQAKASGQAETYANKAAGTAAAAQIQIDEATEAIGYKLLPVVKDLAVFTSDTAVPAVIELVDALGRLGENTGKEAEGIQKTRDDLVDWLANLVGPMPGPWHKDLPSVKAFTAAEIAAGWAALDARDKIEGAVGATVTLGSAMAAAASEIVADNLDIARTYAQSTISFKAWSDHFRTDMQATAPALSTAKDDFGKFLDTLGIGPARAKLQGELTGAKLAAGLKTGTKASRSAGAEMVKTLTDQLNGLDKPESVAAQKAELAGELLTLEHARGIAKAAGDPTRMALIDTMIAGVKTKLSDLSLLAYTYGLNTSSAWSRGIVAGIQIANPQIGGAIKHVQGLFKAMSPPGPESPLHEIDKWGANTGQSWLDNFTGAIAGGKAGIAGALGGLAMPSVGAGSFAMPYAASRPDFSAQAGRISSVSSVSSTASTVNNIVNVTGLIKAETPDDIGRVLRRTAALGMR